MQDDQATRGSEGEGRYDRLTIAIHWTTLLLIAALFATAWLRAAAESGAQAELLLATHRSIGLLLWLLTALRLVWRWTAASHPPLPDSMKRPQRLAARGVEYALYSMLALQPLTGLAHSLLRGKPFGLLIGTMPALLPRDRDLSHRFHDLHAAGAWLFLALIGLHAAAALFHHFALKDGILRSILPWTGDDSGEDATLRTNMFAAGE
jgi:cytochrome b561